MKKITLSLTCQLLLISTLTFAQFGYLDSDFDADGKLTTDFGEGGATANSVAIQSDGKIVVAGSNYNADEDFALVRYNFDGTLDNSFGTGGKVVTDFGITGEGDVALSVAIQPADGKIIAGGYSWNGVKYNFGLARYNTNGTLDNSFSVDGKLTTDMGGADDRIQSVAIQQDGRIVVAGSSYNNGGHFALARYNANGTLDNSFGTGGKVTTSVGSGGAFSVIIQESDGKIVVAGYINFDCAVLRYNEDGSLNNSFGSNGKLIFDFGGSQDILKGLAMQSNGKYIVAGYSIDVLPGDQFALARCKANGTLDNSFSGDGILTFDFDGNSSHASSVVIQSDGKIIVAGSTYNTDSDFALARLNADGSFDNTFGSAGKVITSISDNDYARDLAIQPDGRIVVVGHTYVEEGIPTVISVARYISGLPDCSACLEPTNLNTTNITQTSAKLKWSTEACAIGYKIQYRVKNALDWISININTNVGSKNLTGLAPNTIYEWKIKTKCSSNPNVYSPYTSKKSFTTDAVRAGEMDDDFPISDFVNELKIYPNPATSQIAIDVSDFNGRVQIKMLNIWGENIKTITLQDNEDSTTSLDVFDLADGMYQILISNNAAMKTGKFVKL